MNKFNEIVDNRKGIKYVLDSKCKFLLLFICALPFLAGFYPIVRFSKEQIDIKVSPDHVWVKGIYTYRNPFPFPVIQGFSIPLPIGPSHPDPVMLSAEQLSPVKKLIPVRFIFGKYRFNLPFSPKEEITITVRYRQHSPYKNASYILTTTKPWKRPLEFGLYRLIPKGVKILTSSYPLESKKSNILFFQRNTFMPQAEWQFSWEGI